MGEKISSPYIAVAAITVALLMVAPVVILEHSGSSSRDYRQFESPAEGTPGRSVSYHWYDMFAVPFGDWWDVRNQTAGDYQPWTNSYPYIFRWHGPPPGNLYYYTNMRLNVTAQNLPEINLLNHPEFLPYLGTQRGGNASLAWHGGYMDRASLDARGLFGNDGWLYRWWGNTTLDREGAKAVLGMTDGDFNNFATWWSANKIAKVWSYQAWLNNEGNKRPQTDIWAAYGSTLMWMDFKMDASKAGDKIVVTFDTVSWGMEILMARWLREAFMPTEWYFDQYELNAVIGPNQTSMLDLQSVAVGAAYAYETRNVPEGAARGEPCWVFSSKVQDYVPSTSVHRYSLYDRYYDPLHYPPNPTPYEYVDAAPGSAWNGQAMYYDHTPVAWNLSSNETLTFDWPAGQQLFYYHIGNDRVGSLWDSMCVNYSEPDASDVATAAGASYLKGSVTVDNIADRVTFVGPLNLYNWSRAQTNHQTLYDQWRYQEPGLVIGDHAASYIPNGGILPCGTPLIEWESSHAVPLGLAKFNLTVDQNPTVKGTPFNITVIALDQMGTVFKDYLGTVNFTANASSWTCNLPPNYTFVAGDAGVHTFAGVRFNDAGVYSINVTDHSMMITSVIEWIRVLNEPGSITAFGVVASNPAAGTYTDLKLTAYNQYGQVFTDYRGTVNFSTDAAPGTFVLPSNYTFNAADSGVKMFVNGIMFSVPGFYNLTVIDESNPSIIAVLELIVTSIRPPTTTMTLYDMFEQPWREWWYWRFAPYGTDIVLSNAPHKHTLLYNPDAGGMQGEIFAPYRWNVTALNVTTISAANPEFMLRAGPIVQGSDARLVIHFEYINDSWWSSYWLPTWSSNPDWSMNSVPADQHLDGYRIGVVYHATMNRQAAEEWLGMPQSADPATWWADNGSQYRQQWMDWIYAEGNYRLDIYSGYDGMYADFGTVMSLLELPNGEVVLDIGHVSWGYEVLMTRWTTETSICNHASYMEDFTLSGQYEDSWASITYDAVCQWSLKCVRANESTDGNAWAWEPLRIDYENIGGHPSQFGPWSYLSYMSWNCGDPLYGTDYARYDQTPGWMNLTSYETLLVRCPLGWDVLGYRPGAVEPMAILNVEWYHDYTQYNALMLNGSMQLGFYITNPFAPIDLDSMWNSATKTLTIHGPLTFDQFHWGGDEIGPIYHGTPYLEFNVVPDTIPPVAEAGPDQTINESSVATFDGSGSLDNDAIVNYTWTFDYRGTTVTLFGKCPSFRFDYRGEYNVTLVVRDPEWFTDSDLMRVIVGDVTPPCADAGPDLSIAAGALVTFNGSGSTDDVGIVNWTWWVSCGLVLYGVNPQHRFEDGGVNLAVSLTVRDAAGNNDTDWLSILIDAYPGASFKVNAYIGAPGTEFSFNASASSDYEDSTEALEVRWDWNGDGIWDTLWTTNKSALHIFDAPGPYDVKMEVRDTFGLTNTSDVTVVVTEPVPEFSTLLVPLSIFLGAMIISLNIRKRKP